MCNKCCDGFLYCPWASRVQGQSYNPPPRCRCICHCGYQNPHDGPPCNRCRCNWQLITGYNPITRPMVTVNLNTRFDFTCRCICHNPYPSLLEKDAVARMVSYQMVASVEIVEIREAGQCIPFWGRNSERDFCK
jgi:hypothetical protein